MSLFNQGKFLQSYAVILKNSFYLSLMESVQLILPFIALPYVIKTIGAYHYGKIVLAQVIVGYFMIFVNFGSDILAIKLVSRNRYSKKRLNVITGAVFALKGITFFIGLTLFSLIVLTWQRIRIDWLLFYSAYLLCLTDVLFIPWFFQGIEKMFVITIVRCSSMFIYVICLLLFLKHSEKYYLVPLFQSSALLLTSIYGFYYIFSKEKIRPVLPTTRFMKNFFKKSFPFFLSRSSVILNNSLATLVIGITMSPCNVAAYDLARKIINIALVPVNMIIQAIYPHNVLKRDRRFAMNSFAGVIFFGAAGCAVLYFTAPYIVDFLGNRQLSAAVPMMRFLTIHVLICTFTYYLGSPLLVAWGHSKPFNDSVLISSVIILVIYFIFYICSINSIYYYASAMIVSELVILFYRVFYCIKYGIIKVS